MSNSTNPSAPRSAKPAIQFALAGAVLVIGFILSKWRPVWFAPPNFAATPLTYWFIAQLWIPLWFYAIWKLPSRRLLATLLTLVVMFPLMCLVSLTFTTQNNMDIFYIRNEDFGSLKQGGLNEQHCTTEGEFFTCEMAAGSSDTNQALYTTYKFKLIKGLPFILLIESSSRVGCNPGYPDCQ